jgi:hypothetical protein
LTHSIDPDAQKTDMGNSAPFVFFSYKVNFTREIPNDFYLSGDRVQGIIEIITNDNDNDLNFKYGPLHVELIGELHDFRTNRHQRYAKGDQIFFRKRVQVIKLPNNNQKLVRYSFKRNFFVFRNKMFNIASNFFCTSSKELFSNGIETHDTSFYFFLHENQGYEN